MINTYRATSEYGLAVFREGTFPADFTVIEERDYLQNGHLEIVPRNYTVTSDSFAAGEQGDVIALALPIETEAALVSGGHLERVDEVEEQPEEDEDVEDEPEVEEPTEEEE